MTVLDMKELSVFVVVMVSVAFVTLATVTYKKIFRNVVKTYPNTKQNKHFLTFNAAGTTCITLAASTFAVVGTWGVAGRACRGWTTIDLQFVF